MKPWLLALVLVGCAGGQPPATQHATCDGVVEHTYEMKAGDLRGDFAIAARREFTRLKPRMISMCERANLSIERKRCLVAAEDDAAALACGTKP